MSGNKAVNVALPVAVAERLRREAFEARVSQGSIVADALAALWNRAAIETMDRIERAITDPSSRVRRERADG